MIKIFLVIYIVYNIIAILGILMALHNAGGLDKLEETKIKLTIKGKSIG